MDKDQLPRKLPRFVPFVVLVSGVLGFFALSSLRQVPEAHSVERMPPMVATVPVSTSSTGLKLEAQGEVVPYREVTLSAEVIGRIQSKADNCRAGRFVRQGDLLLTIDPRDYDLAIERIQQSVKQTEVSVEELDVEQENVNSLVQLAESDRELQLEELDRYRALFEKRAASQASLDTARRGRIQVQNAVQTLKNQLALLRTRRGRLLREKDRLLAELQQAMLDRERTEIRAPIDGVVAEDLVERDDYVQRGTALVRLEDISRVEVLFDLTLDELRWIWVGDKSVVVPDQGVGEISYQLPHLSMMVKLALLGQSYEWDGQLSRYDGARLNPATRTVPCVGLVERPREGRLISTSEANLPGPPALLRGMFVTVQVEVPSDLPLIELPTIALRPGNRVWLLQDDRLVIKDVDVALVQEDRTLVLPGKSGLAVGERVIVSPLALAVDGMQLRSEESHSGIEKLSDAASASVPNRSRHEGRRRGGGAMKRLVRFAIENSPAMNMLMIAVLVLGTLSLAVMRREVFPRFELEIVLVTVPYPGGQSGGGRAGDLSED